MKKFKKAEYGRSLLEILAVITLMSFVCIGGVYLGEQMITKYEVQKVSERLNAMINQRRLSMPVLLNKVAKHTEKATSNVELSIENGIDQENAHTFWIIAKTPKASLQSEIADYATENLSPVSVELSDITESGIIKKQVKISLLKFVGNNMPTGLNVVCPEHTLYCVGENIVCTQGYTLKNSQCESCENGEECPTCPSATPYSDGDGGCLQCIDDNHCEETEVCANGTCVPYVEE